MASISWNIPRIIIVLPVTMSYKVINEMALGKIPAFPFPAGTGQVIHKIEDHFTRRSIRYPAQHEELIANNKLVYRVPGVSAGLPFGPEQFIFY